MRTLTTFLVALVAFVALSTFASPAAADNAATAYVFLGHATDEGKFVKPLFEGVPAIKTSLEARTDTPLKAPVTITAIDGLTVRKDHSPKADSLGRLRKGGKVKLVALHNNFGFVWGAIDTTGVLLLAGE